MKVIKLVILTVALISQITVYASYAPYVEEPHIKPQNRFKQVQSSENDVRWLLSQKTQGWADSDVKILNEIIYCESRYNRYAIASTSKEFSVGISQINLRAHTNVTYEQATDINFSLDFLIQHYQQGDAPSMWVTCYNRATS